MSDAPLLDKSPKVPREDLNDAPEYQHQRPRWKSANSCLFQFVGTTIVQWFLAHDSIADRWAVGSPMIIQGSEA